MTGRTYRLLLLTPFAPRLHAPMGGSRVMAQLITRLAARNEVILLCQRGPDEPPVDDALRRACRYVEEVPRSSDLGLSPRSFSAFSQSLAAWWGLLRGRPSWVTEAASSRFAMRTRALAREWSPDVVQFEFHVMAQYLHSIADLGTPSVLTQHDPGTAASEDARRTGQARGWLASRAEVAAWARYERSWLSRMDRIVVFTERDRVAVRKVAPEARAVTIPLAAELPDQPLNPLGVAPPALFFCGNYIHTPNVRAALRLARDIFPPLAATWPELTLELVGPNPPAELLSTASRTIHVHGFVPEVTPYLDRAAVFAAPLDTGGGMRVKVLEALGAGKAVVASPLAVAGLAVQHERELLIAESDDEFVAALSRVLADPTERTRLARAARAWAVEHLDWAEAAAAYERVYGEVIAGRAGKGQPGAQ